MPVPSLRGTGGFLGDSKRACVAGLEALRKLDARHRPWCPLQEDITMLRSSNPILSKQDAFTPAAPQYGQSQFGRSPYQQYPPEAYGRPAPVQQAPEGRMTFDDVVTKTAVTMGVLAIAAGLAWMLVPSALY